MPATYLKKYVKDDSNDPFNKTMNKTFYFKSRIMPGMIMAIGFLILGTQVIAPLIFFKTTDKVSKPMESSVLGTAVGFKDFEFKELKRAGDYKNVSEINDEKFFSLTIPKLTIKNAQVEINSPTLSPDDYIGHYDGTALPGKPGNPFIYGHSVLPFFYNPKNYKTIFSTLDKLVAGDEIIVDFANQSFTYKVESQEILTPDKVNPLAEYKPEYLNESTLTLMTCYPMGTKQKRLMVRAVLIQTQ